MTGPVAGRRSRIVVATADTLGARMAGPAVRAWHIAAALAPEHDVHLVTTGSAAGCAGDGFAVRAVDDAALRRLVDWCDVLVFQGWLLAGRPFIAASGKILVADVYDPMHLEQLEQARDAGDEGRRLAVDRTRRVLDEQLLRADFILCASEKQRDFWLGHLAALGRVNTATYDRDESLRDLLAVVPFGVEDEPPRRTGAGPKGTIAGIEEGDELILWGGGIYNWFDPLSLIEAVDRLRHRRPGVRLLFMGLQHPNPEIPRMQMAVDAMRRSDELGLTGSHVFFNEGWVPFDERQNYLLDAAVGVSTHLEHLETAFSFRTRILDYLWAGLPVITTAGDALAALVNDHDAGLTVPPGDAGAVETALETMLADPAVAARCGANARDLADQLRWSSVLLPLVEFCREPSRAADLVDPTLAPDLERARVAIAAPMRRGWQADVGLVGQHLRDGGPSLLARRVASRVRRWLNRRTDTNRSVDA